MSVRDRLAILQRVRFAIAGRVDELADLVDGPSRRAADTVAAEILPLLAAIRFLEKNARRILRPQRLGVMGRPNWLWGVRGRIDRVPLGTVLVLGTWNYPVFLTGVQVVQAIAAGNRVQVKPGRGCGPVTEWLRDRLVEAGLPADDLVLIDDSTQAAQRAMASGVDLVVLTGSSQTATAVLHQAAHSLTPCLIEASGCDAVFVLPGANLKRVVEAIAFGMRFNGSATCIAPRRVLVTRDQAELLAQALKYKLELMRLVPDADAWQRAVVAAAESGGTVPETCGRVHHEGQDPFSPQSDDPVEVVSPLLVADPRRDSDLLRADLFAPVVSVVPCDDVEDMLAVDAACPYSLGASVFGPRHKAEAVARRVTAGCVTVNDVIVPTADPRVPFGGTDRSGFGVTRGADGLLAMTRPQVVMTRRGRWLPHLDQPHEQDRDLLAGLAEYGYRETLGQRMAGLRRLIRAARR